LLSIAQGCVQHTQTERNTDEYLSTAKDRKLKIVIILRNMGIWIVEQDIFQ
jgi:hypothetical protein